MSGAVAVRHGIVVVVAAGGEEGAVAAAGPPHARSGFGSGPTSHPIRLQQSRAERKMYRVIHQIANKIGSFTGIGGV